MNRPIAIERNHLSLHALVQNAPLALEAPRGTVVSCLSGKLWITQADDPQDYVVRAGYRYCCSKAGLVLVNALNGSGNALVYWTAPDDCPQFTRNGVHADGESHQYLVQRARRLRDATLDRLAQRLAHSLSAGLRRLIQRIRRYGKTSTSKPQ